MARMCPTGTPQPGTRAQPIGGAPRTAHRALMKGWHDPRVDTPEPASVLVVEDDPRLAASVRRALAFEGHRVRVVGDGESALRAMAEGPPDVVLLDRMLPGLDGLTVCRRIREAGDDVPILLLTALDAVEERVAGLDAGADDYLPKPFAYPELLARVRTLLRRRTAAGSPRERLAHADLVIDVGAHEARRGERVLRLSALEFELLAHLARHARLVQTRDRLLDAVWGMDAETASNVVDVYIGYLRRELEAAGEPRLIHTVRGVGYVLREG